MAVKKRKGLLSEEEKYERKRLNDKRQNELNSCTLNGQLSAAFVDPYETAEYTPTEMDNRLFHNLGNGCSMKTKRITK